MSLCAEGPDDHFDGGDDDYKEVMMLSWLNATLLEGTSGNHSRFYGNLSLYSLLFKVTILQCVAFLETSLRKLKKKKSKLF